MCLTHHDTDFAETMPAHHVIAYHGSMRPDRRIQDHHLSHHIARTTRSGMPRKVRRTWAQSVGDWLAARVIEARRLALVTAAWLLGARP